MRGACSHRHKLTSTRGRPLGYILGMNDGRLTDLHTFYSLLASLESKLGGARTLAACTGRLSWPTRGVYFFMEDGESRTESGSGSRIVRVGTHAVTEGARTKLWTRLSQHRGPEKTGGGNHRGSIFRRHIGTAIIARHGHKSLTWGENKKAPALVRQGELPLEREVSKIIRGMRVLWLAIDDASGSESLRSHIERNAIALLSNFGKEPIDAPSTGWLGRWCKEERIGKSGLWNYRHVDERYDPTFLECMERRVADMQRGA
jgi:hypothetical protein